MRRRAPSAPCPRAAAPVAPSPAHGYARAPCVACAWPRFRRGAATAVGGPHPLLWAARALAPSPAAPRPAAPLLPCSAPSAPSAGAALGVGRAGGSSGPRWGPLLAPRGRGAPPLCGARPSPGALCGPPSSLVVARLAQSREVVEGYPGSGFTEILISSGMCPPPPPTTSTGPTWPPPLPPPSFPSPSAH